MSALRITGLDKLIVSGGVGANSKLREKLNAATKRKLCTVNYPRLEFCTDNGAMIAFAGAMRLEATRLKAAHLNTAPTNNLPLDDYGFSVRPRWDLAELTAP